MKSVFADTGYWIALLNERDSLHHRARQLATTLIDVKIVTSEWVLVEVLNGVSSGGPRLRSSATDAVHRLLAIDGTVIHGTVAGSFQSALALYRERPDKDWSLTDCTSFLIMEQFAIKSALTADHHFEQAGFDALLK